MYVKKLVCENYGPIHRFTIEFPIEEDGRPQLIALVGQNGAGKSLVLSALLEALIEIKRKSYVALPEVPADEFFRLQKQDYIRAGQDYSYFEVEVQEGDSTAKLTELTRTLSFEAFQAKYPAAQYAHLQIADERFRESGFFKKAVVPKPIQDAIQHSVALYFPSFRYESPAWLNPSANLRLDTRSTLYGHSTESVVKTNIVHDIEVWILDLILDMELYEKHLVDLPGIPLPAGLQGLKLFVGYQGRNATTRTLLNQILTTIFKAKEPTLQTARIGISPKTSRRVSVIIKRGPGSDEEQIAPTFAHLSSGELMAFSIAATILREHDQLNRAPAAALADIHGIVLIDEADLHLHIQFQKEVLPALFSLFPRVQFVIATHSPFLLLGLSQAPDIPHLIYRLPHGRRIVAEDFIEFQHAYDTFIAREHQFKAAYDSVAARLTTIERPLRITEGKTDWQHMKAAFTRLVAAHEYEDLQFDFHEYDAQEMGDTTLRSMCEQFCRVSHARRVIFVFDRDNVNILGAMEDPVLGYKNWGNNVYSFCIPVPEHRAQYEKVSIESYYTDAELRIPDPATGYRLVFSNEVIKIVKTSLTVRGNSNIKIQLRDAPLEVEEPQKTIFDEDCEKIVDAEDHRVAHSKTVFATQVFLAAAPFHNLVIDAFRPLFDRVRKILNA